MRIYKNLIEAHKEIERDLKETGVWHQGHSYQDKVVADQEHFEFMELSPYVYSLTDWSDEWLFAAEMNLNMEWVKSEFYERLSGYLNPGDAWKLRPQVWAEFIERSGKFSYTYSVRMHRNSALNRVIDELDSHPASRQCVIPIFNGDEDLQNMGGRRRIPCSMFYQFMVRSGTLILHYVMRSCDFYTHFPYDQLLALRLLDYFGDSLGYDQRRFTHIITSLHAFKKDFPKEVF